MPIRLFTEPAGFDQEVRQKGLAFLAKTPKPTASQWSKNAYWQEILPEMSVMYHRICNYCATWIPYSTGRHSVDHFLDKNSNSPQAYEWNNYRYVSARFNSRKGTRAILDPAGLTSQAFVLNFTNFFVEVDPALTSPDLAEATIGILNFNDDDELVNERIEYFKNYQNGNISFDYLQRNAPFIAHEITRQGLRTR